jgi:hypothetical protein
MSGSTATRTKVSAEAGKLLQHIKRMLRSIGKFEQYVEYGVINGAEKLRDLGKIWLLLVAVTSYQTGAGNGPAVLGDRT